jgi:hypothetical protein
MRGTSVCPAFLSWAIPATHCPPFIRPPCPRRPPCWGPAPSVQPSKVCPRAPFICPRHTGLGPLMTCDESPTSLPPPRVSVSPQALLHATARRAASTIVGAAVRPPPAGPACVPPVHPCGGFGIHCRALPDCPTPRIKHCVSPVPGLYTAATAVRTRARPLARARARAARRRAAESLRHAVGRGRSAACAPAHEVTARATPAASWTDETQSRAWATNFR